MWCRRGTGPLSGAGQGRFSPLGSPDPRRPPPEPLPATQTPGLPPLPPAYAARPASVSPGALSGCGHSSAQPPAPRASWLPRCRPVPSRLGAAPTQRLVVPARPGDPPPSSHTHNVSTVGSPSALGLSFLREMEFMTPTSLTHEPWPPPSLLGSPKSMPSPSLRVTPHSQPWGSPNPDGSWARPLHHVTKRLCNPAPSHDPLPEGNFEEGRAAGTPAPQGAGPRYK